jgi:hypothetical protein
MCLKTSYKRKIWNKIFFFFASLKSMKKGVGSGVGSVAGSESIIQRYGSGDPDPHQIVMDPQHFFKHWESYSFVATRGFLAALRPRVLRTTVFLGSFYVKLKIVFNTELVMSRSTVHVDRQIYLKNKALDLFWFAIRSPFNYFPWIDNIQLFIFRLFRFARCLIVVAQPVFR